MKTPEVLFLCVHNAGRSQMAAALMNHQAKGRVKVRSAGSEPASDLNPTVVLALAEIGIDISSEKPKQLANETIGEVDVIVTMGCGESCPVYPGKRYSDWQIEDPAGKSIETIRAIRDQIDQLVKSLLDELLGP
ncbi:MAG: arsenate reductase ArsC [Acidimicrobiaceae bacterium]|nr:arsenate reductase ArsC [Acidimicrobiaceae bacterium]